MKCSRSVVLILSGALVTLGLPMGCTKPPPPNTASTDVEKEQENNSYTPGLGYYHASSFGWFPYPWNFYRSGLGYYHGGSWNANPAAQALPRSRPSASSLSSARSKLGASGPVHSSGSGRSVTRGGFGTSSRPAFS